APPVGLRPDHGRGLDAPPRRTGSPLAAHAAVEDRTVSRSLRRVWLGYSKQDTAQAMAIADALIASGLDCVLSAHDPPTGVTGLEHPEDCELGIVVISRAAVASPSLRGAVAAQFLRLFIHFHIDDVALSASWSRPFERIDATSRAGAFDEHVRRLVAVVVDL